MGRFPESWFFTLSLLLLLTYELVTSYGWFTEEVYWWSVEFARAVDRLPVFHW